MKNNLRILFVGCSLLAISLLAKASSNEKLYFGSYDKLTTEQGTPVIVENDGTVTDLYGTVISETLFDRIGAVN